MDWPPSACCLAFAGLEQPANRSDPPRTAKMPSVNARPMRVRLTRLREPAERRLIVQSFLRRRNGCTCSWAAPRNPRPDSSWLLRSDISRLLGAPPPDYRYIAHSYTDN